MTICSIRRHLKKYRNILGEPRKGIHKYRIFNIAIVDVLLTFVLALLISRTFKLNYIIALCGAFALGIVMHRIFGVRTTIDKLLFTDDDDN